MDIEAYIASGILELYVAGLLSDEENVEVQGYAKKYPEIQKEIEEIEAAILELSKAASPGLPSNSFEAIRPELNKVIDLPSNRKQTGWNNYLGWAAALLFAGGLIWMYLENEKLQKEIEVVSDERSTLEEQILDAQSEIQDTETLLNQLRNRNVAVVALGGQAVSPESYAKAYWNKEDQKVYIDAQGLPEPPAGFAYQVWSLKLNPLTPTSIGLLAEFTSNSKKVFELENPNESEAFGITLEPEGGSEAPNLEQLYTLGAVGQ